MPPGLCLTSKRPAADAGAEQGSSGPADQAAVNIRLAHQAPPGAPQRERRREGEQAGQLLTVVAHSRGERRLAELRVELEHRRPAADDEHRLTLPLARHRPECHRRRPRLCTPLR